MQKKHLMDDLLYVEFYQFTFFLLTANNIK